MSMQNRIQLLENFFISSTYKHTTSCYSNIKSTETKSHSIKTTAKGKTSH